MNEYTNASVPFGAGEIKVSQKQPKPVKQYDKVDLIFSIVYMFLGYLFVRLFMVSAYSNFNASLLFYTAVYVSAVLLYIRLKNIKPVSESLFWLLMMVFVLFFKTQDYFKMFTQIALAAYFTVTACGGLCAKNTSAFLAADAVNCFILLPFENFFANLKSFAAAAKTRLSSANPKKVKIFMPVITGGVMAAIALAVILPLLQKADENFLSGPVLFIRGVLDFLFGRLEMVQIVFYAVFSVPVACYLFGLLYGSASRENLSTFSAESALQMRRSLRLAHGISLKIALYTICAVYLLFIMLQADYLLGVFAGRLYPGMTYAQYARSGFFELCQVCAVNLALLTSAFLLSKKDREKEIEKPALLLCLLSLALLSTATAKMIMYISAYGLTEKRIISTVFLIWLAVVFVMCIIRLKKRFNLTKAALMTGAAMYCMLFCLDLYAISQSYNLIFGF